MQLVPKDTQVIAQTGGGGGWGDPFERNPDAVRWDVIEGLVSRGEAEKQYGVVLNKDYSIHQSATQELRGRGASKQQAAE
jgi:N-methylhydantoinase B